MVRGAIANNNGTGSIFPRMQHTRTRSQQQLTSFEINLEESPLKNARRRANVPTNPLPTTDLKLETESDDREMEGNEENTPTGSPRLGGKGLNDEQRVSRKSGSVSPGPSSMSTLLDDAGKQNALKRSRSPSSEPTNRHRFDFASLVDTDDGTKGARPTPVDVNATPQQKDVNSKRPKLDGNGGKQATLHNFFSKQGLSKTAAIARASPVQHDMDGVIATVATPKASTSKSPAPQVEETPTIAQLKAMPTLDLRTIGPSPKKLTLQGYRSGPSPHKLLRSVSEGSALKNAAIPLVVVEEEEMMAAEIPVETDGLESGGLPFESEESALGHFTVAESDSTERQPASPPIVRKNQSLLSETDRLPPKEVSSTLKQSFKESLFPPSTPRNKILPSRPIGFFSPLTPLPGDETYDYEEEERAVQEHERKLEEAKKAKEALEAARIQTNMCKEKEKAGPSSASNSEGTNREPETGPSKIKRPTAARTKKMKKTVSSTSSANRGAAPITKRAPALRRELTVLASAPSSPRMRTTRAQLLRQKAMQPRKSVTNPSVSSVLRQSSVAEVAEVAESGAEEKPSNPNAKKGQPQPTKSKAESETESKKDATAVKRKFVLTVPSSLSPVKPSITSSVSSPVSSRIFGTGLKKSDSKPFTYSLYPPDISDPAAKAQSKRSLSNLSQALEKLTMPPPEKPASSSRPVPASEQRERIRPATSLGFNRELSLPAPDRLHSEQRPRPQSRSGMLPPTNTVPSFPRFSSSSSSGSSGSGLTRSSGTRFGIGGGMKGTGVFGRHIPRMKASQKTSLETVEGSPVKGAAVRGMIEESSEAETDEIEFVSSRRTSLSHHDAGSETEAGNTSVASVSSSDGTLSANGKELKRISKLDASRRASMAFSALAQSLTTPSPTNVSLKASERQKMASDTDAMPPPSSVRKRDLNVTLGSSSNRPVRAAAQRALTSGYGLVRAESEDIIPPTDRNMGATPMARAESDSELGMSRGSKRGMGTAGRSKMPGSLDVLAHCAIFVDVRTEDGDDAGGLFVDMLRGLGAKVRSAVTQTCTHIVYKNGLNSTVNKYRLLDEPRPHVVGIGWVVECVEKRACIEADKFRINLEEVNVAGMLKRRKSFLHKPVSSTAVSGPMDIFLGGSSSSKPTEPMGIPKACMDVDDDEVNRKPSSMGHSFNPLERARRRSFMITR